MERKAQILEIIIKCAFAIFSLIAIVFIVLNIISMVPMLGNFTSETDIYKAIANTHFGVLYKSLTTYHGKFSFDFVIQALLVFTLKMEWICYIILGLQIILLIINFVLIKWKVVSNYILLSFIMGLLYIIKYIALAIAFSSLLYGDFSKACLSLKYTTILYMIFSIIEVFIAGMFIVKFILNLPIDIKYLLSEEGL